MLQLRRNVWAVVQGGGDEMEGAARRACVCVMCAVMTGCVGLPTMQTAETLEPGRLRLAAGGTLGIAAVDEPVDEELAQLCLLYDTCEPPDLWLIPEVSARMGLAQGLDVGAGYEVGGMLRVDLKPRLYTDGAVTMSLSLGGGYAPQPSFVGAGWTARAWEVSPALLWDYRPGRAPVLVYATARYTQRRVALLREGDGAMVDPTPSWQRSASGSVGLKWGESYGAMVEMGYAAWWGAPDAAQLGVGFFVDLGSR